MAAELRITFPKLDVGRKNGLVILLKNELHADETDLVVASGGVANFKMAVDLSKQRAQRGFEILVMAMDSVWAEVYATETNMALFATGVQLQCPPTWKSRPQVVANESQFSGNSLMATTIRAENCTFTDMTLVGGAGVTSFQSKLVACELRGNIIIGAGRWHMSNMRYPSSIKQEASILSSKIGGKMVSDYSTLDELLLDGCDVGDDGKTLTFTSKVNFTQDTTIHGTINPLMGLGGGILPKGRDASLVMQAASATPNGTDASDSMMMYIKKNQDVSQLPTLVLADMRRIAGMDKHLMLRVSVYVEAPAGGEAVRTSLRVRQDGDRYVEFYNGHPHNDLELTINYSDSRPTPKNPVISSTDSQGVRRIKTTVVSDTVDHLDCSNEMSDLWHLVGQGDDIGLAKKMLDAMNTTTLLFSDGKTSERRQLQRMASALDMALGTTIASDLLPIADDKKHIDPASLTPLLARLHRILELLGIVA